MARPATPQQLATLVQEQQAAEAAALEEQTAQQADDGAGAELASLVAVALAAWVAAFGALTVIGAGAKLVALLAGVRADVDRASRGLGQRAQLALNGALEDATRLGGAHAVDFLRRASGRDHDLPELKVSRDVAEEAGRLAATVAEQLRLAARLLSPRTVSGSGWRGVVLGLAAARRAATLVRQSIAWLIHRAINDGATQVAQHYGALGLWVTEPDACVRCLAYAGRLAGRDGRFPGGLSMDPHTRNLRLAAIDGPPLHPNCFPAGTIASGPGVRAATDRWYEGEMVEVRTGSGRVLTVTPNHPVLTDQGWLPAGALDQGAKVVRDLALDGVLARDPDDYQEPARIEDVARSIRSALGVASVRVPVAAEDFHGDGSDGEVDVIWADGLLRSGAQISEPFGEKQLGRAGADLLALPSCGDLGSVFSRLRASAYRRLSGFRVGAALLRRSTGRQQAVGFSVTPGLQAVLAQKSLNHGAGDASAIRDALDALATLESLDKVGDGFDATRAEFNAAAAQEVVDRLTTDPAFDGEGVETLAGAVALDEVVGVVRFPFAGHVYNLETSGGWYIANGILVHNCRCRLVPWMPDWDTGPGTLPDLLRDQAWRSIATGRGRPTESRAARRRAARALLAQRGLSARVRRQATATAAGRT